MSINLYSVFLVLSLILSFISLFLYRDIIRCLQSISNSLKEISDYRRKYEK